MLKYFDDDKDAAFLSHLKLISPGTPLREGIDSMLQGRTGGLIVIGDSQDIIELIEGGFQIDCEFEPARLYELAKMDGAMVISSDLKRICYANVFLKPNTSIPTGETGMRHQAAERFAKQTGKIVLAISQRRNTLTMFWGSRKYVIRELTTLISGANQTLLLLDRYMAALKISLAVLNRAEISNTVNLSEVVSAIQHTEMVRRTEIELNKYLIELGSEGQSLQFRNPELTSELKEGILVIKDYYIGREENEAEVYERIFKFSAPSFSESGNISAALGYPRDISSYDTILIPRGYRMLSRISRLPMSVIENLVTKFNNLQAILDATIEELQEVEGVGGVRAAMIKGELAEMTFQKYV
ncbi:DNA integrity scanning protein DisA [Candidatus Poribacteria bacterium]|nr:DNA integrity scanning protein DisA [Candidatus Poribacteria bacterium]